jgi:Tripartite tricarboxylate transporter TctB family
MGTLRHILPQKRDYYAGGLMSLIGIGVILEARHYNLGTLFHMGPGFFPIILGVTLTLIGILIAAVAATTEGGEEDILHMPNPQWRAWFCIIAGPVLFIVFGTDWPAVQAYVKFPTGLIPATFACVFVSSLGDRDSKPLNSLILATGITIFGVLLFEYVLQVSMPAWRWGPP